MKLQTRQKLTRILFTLITLALIQSCTTDKNGKTNQTGRKTGVLLVNHGSRSETWRKALLSLQDSVEEQILQSGEIEEVKTAFMEYTEPSIATRMKEFDQEGFTDVIIVPVFLTVSSHSFDDIPTIIGKKTDPKSLELLKVEKIERYTPKASTHITPLLDFSGILKKNILTRVKQLSTEPSGEGLVMIAYGDETYNTEWRKLLTETGEYVKKEAGIQNFDMGWCGHIAHYNSDSTSVAVDRVLKQSEKAIVIPVLVAHDEMFQIKIIGDGIAKVNKNKERVSYKPDAILPDKNIQDWVVNIVHETYQAIKP